MGIGYINYVLIGAKFSIAEIEDKICDSEYAQNLDETQDVLSIFKKYEDNSYKDEICSFNELTAIIDGIDEDYIFFGVVIVRKKESEIGIVNYSELEKYKRKTHAKIRKEFEKLGIQIEFNVYVYAFTHWY
jgi:hypothetical protein